MFAEQSKRSAAKAYEASLVNSRYDSFATMVQAVSLPSERRSATFGVGALQCASAVRTDKMGLIHVSSGDAARSLTQRPRTVHELSGAPAAFYRGSEGVRHFQDARALFEIGIARKAHSLLRAGHRAACRRARC